MNLDDHLLLAETGPGTPMGNLLRRYWTRFSCRRSSRRRRAGARAIHGRGSHRLPRHRGQARAPRRALRASRRVAVFCARTPIAGCAAGITAGQYDLDGNCTDQPNEPPQTQFKEHVKQKAYPCVEKAGAVWAYLGPKRQAAAAAGSRMAERAGKPCLMSPSASSIAIGRRASKATSMHRISASCTSHLRSRCRSIREPRGRLAPCRPQAAPEFAMKLTPAGSCRPRAAHAERPGLLACRAMVLSRLHDDPAARRRSATAGPCLDADRQRQLAGLHLHLAPGAAVACGRD